MGLELCKLFYCLVICSHKLCQTGPHQSLPFAEVESWFEEGIINSGEAVTTLSGWDSEMMPPPWCLEAGGWP